MEICGQFLTLSRQSREPLAAATFFPRLQLSDRCCDFVEIRVARTGRPVIDPALELVSRARAGDDPRAEYDSCEVLVGVAALPNRNRCTHCTALRVEAASLP